MRLVSYAAEEGDAEPGWRAGIVVDGQVVDAGGDSVRQILARGGDLVEFERRARGADTPVGALDTLTLGPPVPDPDKILCIGLNYQEHADETQLSATAAPTVFAKFRNSLIGHRAAIRVPAGVERVDYEGELAVVIGRRSRRLRRDQALGAVAGVMPLNDVSARDLQMQTSQWTMGKALDTFAPCGPELVLLDELGDIQDLRLSTRVNGNVVQDMRTSQMIFSITDILVFVTSVMTLEVGDIIATGTPSGVGFTREPPLLLSDGDRVEVEIEGVGTLSNDVEAEPAGGG